MLVIEAMFEFWPVIFHRAYFSLLSALPRVASEADTVFFSIWRSLWWERIGAISRRNKPPVDAFFRHRRRMKPGTEKFERPENSSAFAAKSNGKKRSVGDLVSYEQKPGPGAWKFYREKQFSDFDENCNGPSSGTTESIPKVSVCKVSSTVGTPIKETPNKAIFALFALKSENAQTRQCVI